MRLQQEKVTSKRTADNATTKNIPDIHNLKCNCRADCTRTCKQPAVCMLGTKLCRPHELLTTEINTPTLYTWERRWLPHPRTPTTSVPSDEHALAR